MGIKGLTKLLADNAPKSMKEQKFESYFGRKIAIDASMSIYQFIIVVGRTGMETLTNEAGEITSHLQGMFSRTIRLLEAGMKPVYVFDGQPPDLKKQELTKRYSRREDATKELNTAIEAGDKDAIEKFNKRIVKEMAAADHQPEVFLLKFSCYDRMGLLHDVTEVLSELELTIMRVKVSTTPVGRVMDLFFITDTRKLLHTKMRQDETCEQLRAVLGDSMASCDIEPASPEIAAYLQASPFLPPEVTEEMFSLELPEQPPGGSSPATNSPSVTMDNSLSPSHTLVQILCRDHKGLLYDIMRTFKDYNIQIAYGRFYATHQGSCEIDLFVMQMDGKKIVDLNKQTALCARLRMELFSPLRVTVVSRGPDKELLVANPVELSGKGRPLVFYDITLALKTLRTRIFLAEIGRHVVGDREWEVYRVLLADDHELSGRSKMVEGVTKMLMGWE